MSSAVSMLIVVNYHYVRPTFDLSYGGIRGVTPPEFEAQLRLLGSVGEFVSGAQVREAIRGLGCLPSRAILVTFDDGLREQFEHALPVLRRLGIPAIFFVNTQPIAGRTVSAAHKIHLLRSHVHATQFRGLLERCAREHGIAAAFDADGADAGEHYRYDTPEDARLKYGLNFELAPEVRDVLIAACFRAVFGDSEEAVSARLYMDVRQLREACEWGCVGAHGHEHVPFGRLPYAAVRRSVETSLGLLTAWLGYRPYALSYPYGSYRACTRDAGRAAADAGIEFAFTMERAGNADLTSPLYLGRFDCNDVPGGKHARLAVAELFERTPCARWHRSPSGVREPAAAAEPGDRGGG